MMNVMLARQLGGENVPYQPVDETALYERRAKIKADKIRPRMAREKRLAAEHVLLDTVNLRAKLVYVQMGRVEKALMFEEKVGEGTALKVLVPEVKDELVVLSRLMTDYKIVMEKVGLLGPKPGMTPSHHIEIRVPAPHVDASIGKVARENP